MNAADMEKLCSDLVTHAGCDSVNVAKALSLWKPNLLNIEYEKALESIKVNLINGSPTGKDPSKWFAAVVRYTGSSTSPTVNQNTGSKKEEPKGCETCRHSGTIEVPHDGDWSDGRWRGIYTMVVACDCGMGQMRACQMVNIRQYDHKYPHWRNEYPMRMYERQLREMLVKPVPYHREDREMHLGKISMLKGLLGEVSDKPQHVSWNGGSLKELLSHCVKQFS